MNISDDNTNELDSYGVWVKNSKNDDGTSTENQDTLQDSLTEEIPTDDSSLDLPDFNDSDFSDMFKDDSQFSSEFNKEETFSDDFSYYGSLSVTKKGDFTKRSAVYSKVKIDEFETICFKSQCFEHWTTETDYSQYHTCEIYDR